jgi:hypothetical protein
MDFFVGSTIVLGIWAAVGPLVGVRYGDELSRRSQRKQWLLDNKKEEFRELIGVFMKDINAVTPDNTNLGYVIEVIYNRLFIAEEIKQINLQSRWMDILLTYAVDKDRDTFGAAALALHKELLALALRTCGEE